MSRTIESMKEYIQLQINTRGFDKNGDIEIDFAGLCEASDVVLAAAELGYDATPSIGQGVWWISKSDSSL
jgi:hypothetical protein